LIASPIVALAPLWITWTELLDNWISTLVTVYRCLLGSTIHEVPEWWRSRSVLYSAALALPCCYSALPRVA